MNPRTTLATASIAFAVLWTAAMLWWNAPLDPVPTVILVISGGMAGFLWYWLFGLWFRRHFGA